MFCHHHQNRPDRDPGPYAVANTESFPNLIFYFGFKKKKITSSFKLLLNKANKYTYILLVPWFILMNLCPFLLLGNFFFLLLYKNSLHIKDNPSPHVVNILFLICLLILAKVSLSCSDSTRLLRCCKANCFYFLPLMAIPSISDFQALFLRKGFCLWNSNRQKEKNNNLT